LSLKPLIRLVFPRSEGKRVGGEADRVDEERRGGEKGAVGAVGSLSKKKGKKPSAEWTGNQIFAPFGRSKSAGGLKTVQWGKLG